MIRDDPSDDKFLEAAVAGRASCIVSGDKHLLKLFEVQGIPILRPKDFVQKYLRIESEGRT
jgi:predicted nucleic acid-binding protein